MENVLLGYYIFMALVFGAPFVLIIANLKILVKIYKNITLRSIPKSASKICFIQHLIPWIIVTVIANIINDGGFDGLSINQSVMLLVVGLMSYLIIGYFVLRYYTGKTIGLFKIHFLTSIILIIFLALYLFILYLFGSSLPTLF